MPESLEKQVEVLSDRVQALAERVQDWDVVRERVRLELVGLRDVVGLVAIHLANIEQLVRSAQ